MPPLIASPAVPAVTVIVPVYNPGPHIDACIRTLLDQSLPAEDYEVIFVDDGSTDETPDRLDALAHAHPNVRAVHIANSGWPGRPRNIGLELARGDYVYFVDNDDWLAPEALERLLARARADDADIVVGKVVGHGKGVPRPLFRRNQRDVALGTAPLLQLLSPHKLFRRSFLEAHDIRFPEGRRRLEDHVFVVHAYCHTTAISILADYACYHWVSREDRHNASLQRLDPVAYYGNVREVLDVVEAHLPPGPVRDRLRVHWYRGKMLMRVGGRPFARREEAFNRLITEEVRRLAVERFSRADEELLPYHLRVRARLLRDGSYEDLLALATFESQLRLRAKASVRPDGQGLAIDVTARLVAEEPLRFVAEGDRVRWLPPAALAERIPPELLGATDAVRDSEIHTFVRSRSDGSEFLLDVNADPTIETDGTLTLRTSVHLDPREAAGGGVLPDGEWELHAAVAAAGFPGVAALRHGRRKVILEVNGGRARELVPPTPARPRPTLRRRVARRVPWLVPLVRRA